MTRLSVIIATYNKPQFLEKVLHGFSLQTDTDFEVVIADDGSTQETTDLLNRVRASGVQIVHVWHEDRGFRKTEILNRAILVAKGDYFLFTDGDCIPRADLISVHRRLARSGRYVAGGYVKLPASISDSLSPSDVESGRFADLKWLRSRGWKPRRRALRLSRSWRLASLYDWITPTAADFQGNNVSAWRDSIVDVNGFEGDMGYGGLDQALGYRLQNAGVRGIQARHRAVTMHLHHDRPYRDQAIVRENKNLMKRIRREKEVRAHRGLAELGPDPSLRVSR
ncbi:MAG: glycosyltransferase [Gemmatimonadales bacterium]